jgi:lysophospholipase L1-like esterase
VLPAIRRSVMHPMPRHTRLKHVVAAAAAGTGALGGVGILAFVQARLAGIGSAAQYPLHWLDGDVGPAHPSAHRVVWLGDSLAAGLGAIAPDVTLPRLVASHSDRRTRLHVFATPGATSTDVVECQLPALVQLRHGLGQIGQRIDAVGVTVGANDIASLTSRRRFRRNVAAIAAAADGAPLVLVSIPGLADAIRLPHPLRALASVRGRWLDRVLRDAARSRGHIQYANVWQRPPWIERRHRAHFLSGDRYHPSGAGYAIWADRVAAAFAIALHPVAAT